MAMDVLLARLPPLRKIFSTSSHSEILSSWSSSLFRDGNLGPPIPEISRSVRFDGQRVSSVSFSKATVGISSRNRTSTSVTAIRWHITTIVTIQSLQGLETLGKHLSCVGPPPRQCEHCLSRPERKGSAMIELPDLVKIQAARIRSPHLLLGVVLRVSVYATGQA